MRGENNKQEVIFSYLSPEVRVRDALQSADKRLPLPHS